MIFSKSPGLRNLVRISRCAALVWLGSMTDAFTAEIPETAIIPLETEKITLRNGDEQETIYKLGINVSLGGGAFRLYEFDTGASGFYAAYNPRWWKSYRSTGTSFTAGYGDGVEYQGVVAYTTISLGHGVPPVSTKVGLIQDGSGGPIPNWNEDVNMGRPPLWGSFFGDFGADLTSQSGSGLFSILPQLPGNLSSGFIVSTGGNRAPNPHVILGLTEQLRSQFPMQVQMNGAPGNFPNLDKEGPARPLYQQEIIDATLMLKKGKSSLSVSTGVILDCGAPSMTIDDVDHGFRIPESIVEDGDLISGIRLSLVAGGKNTPPWPLAFTTGSVPGFTKVEYTDEGDKAPYLNAGLNAFFRYDVMFDVENGVVGFRRIGKGGPVVRIFGPSEISTEWASLTIRGLARGGSQLLSSIQIRQGTTGTFRLIPAGPRWSAIVDLEPGVNTIYIRAVDVVGRKSAPEKITIVRE